MQEKEYTKKEVLKAIEEAFYAGVQAGGVEYGDEYFLPEDYLPEKDKVE